MGPSRIAGIRPVFIFLFTLISTLLLASCGADIHKKGHQR